VTVRHKEFMIAFAEGKTVEYRNPQLDEKWTRVTGSCAISVFNVEHLALRIKPRMVKVERWVNVCVRSSGFIDERVFVKEHDARGDAAFLREDGQRVLAEAVHLCTEVEVAE